jgi:glyoxylase-like metal-dependent hydrolase (beta-lactamase superfamily II)
VLPVSSTMAWLKAFASLEQWAPQRIVPGHGRVTDLAAARAQAKACLETLRAHMKRAVEQGVDVNEAVKSQSCSYTCRALPS